jgi:glycosyltransferase involved in cell wall biosynthesis
MKFSVLMSIYCNEDAKHFHRAVQSIWDEQTIKPNEIVLVEDGPLSDSLYKNISDWKDRLGEVFKVVHLEKNAGVGNAKYVGIYECSNELIAVMDTDDISQPNRFEQQLAVFDSQDIDVCGAWVGEFENDENEVVSYRRTPEHHDEIVAFAKSRSPVNHPTAMYKKSSVLNAGNYTKYKTSEDYDLFVKLIMSGAKLYNIQQPLVNMRMGNNQAARRGGLRNAMLEANVQKEFYEMGFLNFYEFFKNVSVGFVVRILPSSLMKVIFKIIRKL